MLMSRGVPPEYSMIRSTAGLVNNSRSCAPAMRSRVLMYSRVSSRASGGIWQRSPIRCVSCASSGSWSLALSSGCPTSRICKSLVVGVSKFESSRMSSSVAGARFCASSRMRTVFWPVRSRSMRKLFSAMSRRARDSPPLAIPRSSRTYSRRPSKVRYTPRSSGATTSPQERDQLLVSAGGEVGEAANHDEADEGGARSESHVPRAAAAVGPGDDPRDTDQHRHRAERPEIVDCVEGRVDPLGQDHGADGQAERSHQSHEEQPEPVGRCRLRVRDRRVEHAKLFALLALLHALGELRLLVALQQRVVELAGAVVVAGELPEFLFPPRHVLNPGLVGRDSVVEALVVVLEDPDLRLNLAQGLFQAEHIRREGGGGWRRLFLFRFGLAGLGVSDLALERGDLPRQH